MLIHATGSRYAGGKEDMPITECVKPVLNLALQNVAIERDEMVPHCEEMVSRNNSLTKLRQAAQGNAALKEAYTNSMASVFSRQDLKGSRLRTAHVLPSSR